MNHFRGDSTHISKNLRQPYNKTPFRQLLKTNPVKTTTAYKLKRKKTNQRIKTPIRTRETSKRDFRSDPIPNF